MANWKCSRPEGCVCGGDLPAIRAACGWFAGAVAERDDVERDIRIAIWNAGMNGGMGQDLTQAFIRRAMAEPSMVRALESLSPTGVEEEA